MILDAICENKLKAFKKQTIATRILNRNLPLLYVIQYVTKASTLLTFYQSFYYIFSRDNFIQMKRGYIITITKAQLQNQ